MSRPSSGSRGSFSVTMDGGAGSSSYRMMSASPDADPRRRHSDSTGRSRTSSHAKAYTIYRRRFVVLLAFSLLSIGNQIIYGTFTTISTEASAHFDVGYLAVDYASTVFLIMFVPSSVLVPLMVSRWGHGATLYLSAAATVVGPWLRMVNADSIVWMLIGQTVTAVGQPILFANIPAISQTWFPDNERAVATGLMFVANNIIGIGVSLQIPAYLAETPDGIPNCMFVQAIVCTVLVAAFVLAYREAPPTPPSASAALQMRDHARQQRQRQPQHSKPPHDDHGRVGSVNSGGADSLQQPRSPGKGDDKRNWLLDSSTDAIKDFGASMSFQHSMAHLFSNVQWLLLVLMNGMFVAVFSALPTFGNRFLESYGYKDTFFASVGAVFLLSGAVGTFVVTPILDRTHAFKKVLGVLCTLCALSVVVASWQMRPNNGLMIVVLFGMAGATSVPATAAFVELGCEVAYPVPESTQSGVLFMVGQVLAIAFIVVSNRIMANNDADVLRWLMAGCITSTLLFLAVFKGKLKRLQVDMASNSSA